VGPITGEDAALLRACERALWAGLAQARPGNRLSDISHAVETSARASGRYGIVREYVGHGIGTEMHMDPAVPNYGKPGHGPMLAEGMALAIEPMLVRGRPQTRLLDDGWTVVSADGSRAAHFEHTVAITASGPWVLTAEDGGAAALDGGVTAQDGKTAQDGRAAALDGGVVAGDGGVVAQDGGVVAQHGGAAALDGGAAAEGALEELRRT
jgi:methionyl aminopeptidase